MAAALEDAPDLSSSVSTLGIAHSPRTPDNENDDDISHAVTQQVSSLGLDQKPPPLLLDLTPPPQVDNDDNDSDGVDTAGDKPQIRRNSTTSMSLLYPDTAPRTTWRPQLTAWMKKNYPQKLKEIAQTQPPRITPAAQPFSFAPRKSRSASVSHVPVYPQTIPRSSSVSSLSSAPGLTSASSSGYTSGYTSASTSAAVSTSASGYAGHNSRASSPTNSLHQLSHGRPRRLSQSHFEKPYSRPRDDDEMNPLLLSYAPRLPSPPQSPEMTPLPPALAGRFDQGLAFPAAQRQPAPPKPAAPLTHSHSLKRRCISCGSDQSPCWRPSWSAAAGQLCNSCGLRYKKTGARCTSGGCGRIPAKGEWVMMKRNAVAAGHHPPQYNCLTCGSAVAVGEHP